MKQSIKLLNKLRDELNDINTATKISDIIISIIDESAKIKRDSCERNYKQKLELINKLTK